MTQKQSSTVKQASKQEVLDLLDRLVEKIHMSIEREAKEMGFDSVEKYREYMDRTTKEINDYLDSVPEEEWKALIAPSRSDE